MKKIILVLMLLIGHCIPIRLLKQVTGISLRSTLFIIILNLTFNIENCTSQVWSPLGSGINNGINPSVYSFAIFNNELIVGGSFTSAGGINVNNIAKWNGVSWAGFSSGTNNTINAMTVFNNELIAGGYFSTAGFGSALRIAKWNGTNSSPLGSGLNNYVYALTVFNGELIAGGNFDSAGGVRANRIAKWNGTSWSPLGSGMGGTNPIVEVKTLIVYNSELIAGGFFTSAGGVSASSIAKWNGTSWSSLGEGLSLGEQTANASTIYNNELIVCGGFGMAGGIYANYIAKWNGTTWSTLGTGLGFGAYALTVYNNELIAGGSFTSAGGVSVNSIAKWNGTNWSTLGSGLTGTVGIGGPIVMGLAVYNNELYAGGRFTMAGGNSAHCIAKWWIPHSVSGTVRYADNNQPVTSGKVKAFKFDRNTWNVIYLDSANLQPDGSYILQNVPQDSIDIGVFPNSTPPNDYVITYYPSTVYWEHATVLYPTGNLTNIDIGAIRMTPATNSNSVNGKVMRLNDNPVANLKDAVLYAKNGNTFVRCAVSDGNGVYHLNSLPVGNLKVIVNRLGFKGDSATVNVTATSNIDSINFFLYNILTGVKKINSTVPSEYKLYQNYPNPFNPVTSIRYQVASKENGKWKKENGIITLKVYDILGKEIATLVNEKQEAGVYEVMFDGSYLSSGIYFYKLIAGDFSETKRMILIK